MTQQLSHILLSKISTNDIVQIFHSQKLFTDDDLEAVSFIPSEYLKSQFLMGKLQYFKLTIWLMICDIMHNDKSLEHIGSELRDGT